MKLNVDAFKDNTQTNQREYCNIVATNKIIIVKYREKETENPEEEKL